MQKTAVDQALATKQDQLTTSNFGAGLSYNPVTKVISNTQTGGGSSGSSLGIQLNGVAQSVSALNFLRRESLLANGVLTLAESSEQPELRLFYQTAADALALRQNGSGDLEWHNAVLATEAFVNTGLGTKQSTLSQGPGVLINASNQISAGIYTAAHPLSVTTGGAGTLGGDLELNFATGLRVQNNALEIDQSWVSSNYVSGPALTSTLGNYQPLLTQSQHAGTGIAIVSGKIQLTPAVPLVNQNTGVSKFLEHANSGELLWDGNVMATTAHVGHTYQEKLTAGTGLTLDPSTHTLDAAVYTAGNGIIVNPTTHVIEAAVSGSNSIQRTLGASGQYIFETTGNDTRNQLNMRDSGGYIRNLQFSQSGELVIVDPNFGGSLPYNINYEIGRRGFAFTPSPPLRFASTALVLDVETGGPLQVNASSKLECTFKPSNISVSVATGLMKTAEDDVAGTMTLALSGQEPRVALKLEDPTNNSIIRDLTSNGSAELIWDGNNLTQIIDGKAQDFLPLDPLAFFNFNNLKYLQCKFKPSTVTGVNGVTVKSHSDSAGTLELELDQTYLAGFNTLISQNNPFLTSPNASGHSQQLWLSDIGNISTNAFLLTQSTNNTRTLHWGSTHWKSYDYLKETHLNKIQNAVISSHSSISLGGSNLLNYAQHKIAVFEDLTTTGITPGSFFYGLAYYRNNSQYGPTVFTPNRSMKFTTTGEEGLAIYGGGQNLTPSQIGLANNIYAEPVALFTKDHLRVGGDIHASGTKTFDVSHPLDESKRLRHHAVENPTPMLSYNFTIEFTSKQQTMELPAYYKEINAPDAAVFMNPKGHFGSGYGSVSGNTLTMHVSTVGWWNVCIMSVRKDAHIDGTNMPAEYEPPPPSEPTSPP